jgi:hypothetical protein
LLDAPPVWLGDVAAGVADGSVSVGAAAAIVTGLGEPTADVGADDLLDAAQTLVAEAASLPPEKVAKRARELRDELDAAGIADREEALRQKRLLRLTPRPDGMTSIFGLLDPESAALVTDAIDCVTAPRRNGPRFLDDTERARADAIMNDPRTTEQLALDALVEMIRIASVADPGRVFGIRKPAVRVHVDASDLEQREGAGHLEGQTATVSIQTVERLACTDGYIPVLFQSGGPIDVGLTQRLFTTRQRIALAAIWAAAPTPTATDHPPGAKPTTPSNGTTADPPTSETVSCSAASTTCSPTTWAGPSDHPTNPTAPGSCTPHPAGPASANPSNSPAKAPCGESSRPQARRRALPFPDLLL